MSRPHRKWLKSSYCSSSHGVEVGFGPDDVALRDSKYRRTPAKAATIVVDYPDWKEFLWILEEVDFPSSTRLFAENSSKEGHVDLWATPDTTSVLSYADEEWQAFVRGAREGEFEPPKVFEDAATSRRLRRRWILPSAVALIVSCTVGLLAASAGWQGTAFVCAVIAAAAVNVLVLCLVRPRL